MLRTLICTLAVAGVLAGSAAAGEAEAPATAKTPEEEVDGLFRLGEARAKARLVDGIGFLAFAYALDDDGQPQLVRAPEVEMVPAVEGHADDPAKALEGVVEKLRASKSQYRAVAIFSDVTIAMHGKQTDAIQVGLEHESGYCRDVFTPYARMEQGDPTFGEDVSSKRQGKVFECH